MIPYAAAPSAAADSRKLKTAVVMSCYLLVLVFRGYAHLLPFQLKNQPIVWVGNNLAGALYKYYGIYHWVVENPIGAGLLTFLLFADPPAVAIYPRSRLAACVFAAAFTLYAIAFSAHLGHNAHLIALLVVLSLVFLPRKDAAFALLWEGMRYYVCCLYVVAFVFKIAKGAAFQPDFGLLSFQANLSEYLLLNPETVRAHLYYFCLQYPALLNIGAKVVFAMEGLFVIGFFTRKYDLFLIALAILIPTATFLFADTFFFESLPASLVFVPERYWQKLSAALQRK